MKEQYNMSRPVWARGLKFVGPCSGRWWKPVASRVGAGIEIPMPFAASIDVGGRVPCGRGD